MIFFAICFCLYFAVQGLDFENNDSKYIDLLPVNEKAEFVEKVARRLLIEIKPVPVPKEKSILITDEELNKTAEYVKKVVKEESIKFERTRKNDVKEKNKTVTLSIDDVQKYETTTSGKPTNKKSVQKVHKKTRKDGKNSKSNSDQETLTSESDEESNESATMEPEYLNLQESKNKSVDVLRSDTHIDLTLRSGKKEIRRNSDEIDINGESYLENSKNDIYEQVTEKSIYNITSQKADSDQSNVSSTTQITETTLTLDNFTSNNGYKITDSKFTNSSDLVESHYMVNDLDKVKATNIVEPTTILFEPTTEKQVKNKSSILIGSTEDVLTAKITNNETLTHQNQSSINIIVDTVNQSNKTKALRSLDSELFATIAKNNDLYKINETTTEKALKSVKDDTDYLKILKSKYVETLPPDLDNVEEQIPKPYENNDYKLSSTGQNVPKSDVFEVEPDESEALLLRSDDTNKDKEETHIVIANDGAPHYAPVHDYAPENVYYNARNNLGPNSDDQNLTVIEAESGRSSFPLRTSGGNKSNAEEPYYAPVHNYAPENAYYNAENRLGPNAEEEEVAKGFADRRGNDIMKEKTLRYGPVHDIDEDYYNQSSEKHNYNVNRKFDFKIKKPQNNHKLKQSVGVPDQPNKSRTLSPDDYFDMDYFFGRSKTDDEKSVSPNKHVGTNNNLKSILKRNRIEARTQLISKILKDLKEEERVSRNGQSFAADYYWSRVASGSTEIKPRFPVFHSSEKNEKDVKDTLRNNFEDARNLVINEKKGHFSLVDFEDLPTKDEYFSNKRKVKSLASIESLYPQKFPYSKKEHDETREKSKENNDNDVENHKKSKETKDVDVKNSKEYVEKENDDGNKESKKCQKRKEDKNITENHNSTLSSLEKTEVKFENAESINEEAKGKTFLRTLDIDFVIEPYITALENLIKNNSEGLRKYDWLGTTVDLQAALDKLINLADSDPDEDIHPNDKAVLKYIQLLYDSSQEVLSSDLKLKAYNPYLYLRKNTRRGILPRSNRKSKAKNAIQMLADFHRMLREIYENNGNDDQQYVVLDDIRVGRDSEVDKKEELLHFFVDLRSSLYQFHNTLKHISSVTKFKNQKWYENLKEVYLGRPKRKQLIEVLLHLFSIRLFGLIEESAKNGLEKDYISYVLEHKEEVRRTKDELVFVIKLVNEIKRIDGVD